MPTFPSCPTCGGQLPGAAIGCRTCRKGNPGRRALHVLRSRLAAAAVLVFVAAAVAGLAAARNLGGAAPEGFTPLFNGKSLKGWKVHNGRPEAWGVADGVLFTTGDHGGWLMTKKEYADFELLLEYRVAPGGNSGVALRSPPEGDPAYAGMEFQILDDAAYPSFRPDQLNGGIYDVVPPAARAARPAGEWNRVHIVAQGRRVHAELNDTPVLDADLDAYADRADRHPGLRRPTGRIGLQSHDGRVEFRGVYVKPL